MDGRMFPGIRISWGLLAQRQHQQHNWRRHDRLCLSFYLGLRFHMGPLGVGSKLRAIPDKSQGHMLRSCHRSQLDLQLPHRFLHTLHHKGDRLQVRLCIRSLLYRPGDRRLFLPDREPRSHFGRN